MESIAVGHAPAPSRAVAFVLAMVVAVVGAAMGPAIVMAAPASSTGTSSQSDAAAKLKMVVIVGPTHSSTNSYLSRGETIAQTGEKYGMDVRRVFHPRATPARVLANVQGANIVAYLGHGNGWPSPYAPFQERTKNGFGLNPVEGGSANTVEYYGGNWIRNNITLAPNAVVLFQGLCYAEGNGESGMAIPSWSVAHQRVDNFAAALLAVNAQAVFAYGWQSVTSVVDMLHTTNKTMDEIFMTKVTSGTSPSSGFLGWDNRRLNSVRMPGFKNHLDPHSTSGFLRALSGNLNMTASDWSGAEPPSEIVPPPAAGPTVPTGLAGAADATGAVALSWNASTADMIGDIKYRVFRNDKAIGSLQTARTYVDRPAKSGSYKYQVRAVDPAGNKSELSAPINVSVTVPVASPSPTPTATATASPTTTPKPSPTATPTASPTSTPAPAATPSVPKNLTGSAQDNYVVKLSWGASVSAASGPIKYRVFRNGRAIGTKQTGTTFTDQRLASKTFNYQVRAIDAAGNKSALSPAVSVTTTLVATGSGGSNLTGPDTTPPSKPTGLKTEALGYRYVRLSWSASTDNSAEPVRYRVFRNDKRIATVTTLTFTDRPKNPGQHTYKVRAMDAAGNLSAFSDTRLGQAVSGPI